ncbi:TPA: hypothetical protein ACHLGH_004874, partial [Escherichia coli]
NIFAATDRGTSLCKIAIRCDCITGALLYTINVFLFLQRKKTLKNAKSYSMSYKKSEEPNR